MIDAVWASISLPGLFPPFHDQDRWLLDGGLVNPVPVSVCRALGADIVIAVNLNDDLVGRHFFIHEAEADASDDDSERELAEIEEKDSTVAKWAARMKAGFGVRLDSYISSLRKKESPDPGLFDVMAGSIDIMQDRITRSRMAGEPPDVVIAPRLGQIGLMDFDRAKESIAEGREATKRRVHDIETLPKAVRGN